MLEAIGKGIAAWQEAESKLWRSDVHPPGIHRMAKFIRDSIADHLLATRDNRITITLERLPDGTAWSADLYVKTGNWYYPADSKGIDLEDVEAYYRRVQ